MDQLKEQAKDDPTAWRDYRSPKNRTYWWNEAKNSSGGCRREWVQHGGSPLSASRQSCAWPAPPCSVGAARA